MDAAALLQGQHPQTVHSGGLAGWRWVGGLVVAGIQLRPPTRPTLPPFQLLSKLSQWSEREDVSPEERELAKKLHDDFARFLPADVPERADAAAATSTAAATAASTVAASEADHAAVGPAGADVIAPSEPVATAAPPLVIGVDLDRVHRTCLAT